MCQHTAGAHNHQWRGLLEDEEITANYRVIAYDLPRHGKSDPPENTEWWTEEYKLSADHYANFIVALVDALELENPIFMGSSFGGNIALQLALRNPDRFAGVIPVEGADYSPGFYLDWWQHPHANAAQVCASGTWDLMAPQSPEADRWKTWFYYTQGSEAFKGDLHFYSVDHDLRDKLDQIDGDRCPVVMLTGDYDYLTTPEDSGPNGRANQERAVHRDERHRSLPDEREPRSLPHLPHPSARDSPEERSHRNPSDLSSTSTRSPAHRNKGVGEQLFVHFEEEYR